MNNANADGSTIDTPCLCRGPRRLACAYLAAVLVYAYAPCPPLPPRRCVVAVSMCVCVETVTVVTRYTVSRVTHVARADVQIGIPPAPPALSLPPRPPIPCSLLPALSLPVPPPTAALPRLPPPVDDKCEHLHLAVSRARRRRGVNGVRRLARACGPAPRAHLHTGSGGTVSDCSCAPVA